MNEDLVQLATAERGLRIRTLDGAVIPPLSDYHAFMTREIPFLFFTAGRSRYQPNASNDYGTLRTLLDVLSPLREQPSRDPLQHRNPASCEMRP